MKKFFLLVCVSILSLTLLSAVQAQVIRFAADDLVDPNNYVYAPARYLAKVIEEATMGKMKMEIHGGAVLGNGKSIVEQCQAGIIEVTESVEGLLAYFYPNIQVTAIPYIFRTEDIAYAVLDGSFGQEMREDFRKKTGLRIISWAENGGFRNFTTSKKKIKSPADMKGLKIRTMEIPAHMAMVKALGANPIPIAWTELYTALQTGVADGQENAIPTIMLGKLEEVQKYVVLDKHVYSMQLVIVNDAWFLKQDKPLQNAILSAGRVMDAITRGICRLGELNGTDYLKKKGLEIYQPTAEEYQQFKTLAQKPVIEWLRNQKNVDNVWIDKLLKAVSDTEKQMGYR
jgi:tripartite ATP-independent transporter DctP family solute receptor